MRLDKGTFGGKKPAIEGAGRGLCRRFSGGVADDGGDGERLSFSDTESSFISSTGEGALGKVREVGETLALLDERCELSLGRVCVREAWLCVRVGSEVVEAREVRVDRLLF